MSFRQGLLTLPEQEFADGVADKVEFGKEPVDEVFSERLRRKVSHEIVNFFGRDAAFVEQLLELFCGGAVVIETERDGFGSCNELQCQVTEDLCRAYGLGSWVTS